MDNGHIIREKSIHYHNTDGKLLVRESELLATGRKLWEFSACPSCLAFLSVRDRTWIKAQNLAVFFSQSQLGLVRQAGTQTGATGKHGNVARRPGWGTVGEHEPFPALLVVLL